MAKILGTTPGFYYPVPNGTVTINSSGISVYHGEAGDVPMQDPVPLSTIGEELIYLKGDQNYTYVIKDEDGTTQQTVASVTSIPSPSRLTNNLDINGNSIISSANGDITITSDGDGFIVLDGITWPAADGSTNTTLTTGGDGTLSLSTGTTEILLDTTPQLGAALDCNAYYVLLDSGTGISDDSGNEQLLFTSVTSAVNYLNMTNAATAGGVTLATAGSDSNIDFNINAKGTGNVVLSGYSLPSSDGALNNVAYTDGAATIGFDTLTNIVGNNGSASQATMETATSTTDIVAPANLHYHPGIAKAWCITPSTAGQTTPAAGYNITSHTATVTTGTSDPVSITFNFTTAMSSANYAVFILSNNTAGGLYAQTYWISARSTTSFTIDLLRAGFSNNTTNLSVLVLGDQ